MVCGTRWKSRIEAKEGVASWLGSSEDHVVTLIQQGYGSCNSYHEVYGSSDLPFIFCVMIRRSS